MAASVQCRSVSVLPCLRQWHIWHQSRPHRSQHMTSAPFSRREQRCPVACPCSAPDFSAADAPFEDPQWGLCTQEQWNTIQTLLPMRVFIQLPHDILTLMSSDPAVAAEVLISLREENPEAPVGRIVQKAPQQFRKRLEASLGPEAVAAAQEHMKHLQRRAYSSC